MRPSYTERTLFIENDVCLGVNLGFDFCHEHGSEAITRLAPLLGVATPRFHAGVETRTMRAPIRPNLVYCKDLKKTGRGAKKTDETILVVARGATAETEFLDDRTSQLLPALHRDYRTKTWQAVATAWGSDGFVIRATSDAWRHATHHIHSCLMSGTLALGVSGSSNPFSGAGLSLVDSTLLPETIKAKVALDDENARRLDVAAQATGIRHRLEQANLGWHALEPNWYADPNSVYPVHFFLNPAKQQAYNHGWFTVEDLDAWIAQSGPVMKG